MPIDREILRSALLEALRRERNAGRITQFESLKEATAAVLYERELPVQLSQPVNRGGHPALHQGDERRFRELITTLIVEGIVTWGANDNNPAWPFLGLTEDGEAYIQHDQRTPYDPSGYLAGLNKSAALDPIEARYLPQAIEAFRKGMPDAAAVMLGAASEHLLIKLGEEIKEKDPDVPKELCSKINGPVLPLLRELRRYFEARVRDLPLSSRESLSTTFSGVAELIRRARNDAGHPRLEPTSREHLFISLQLFPEYRKWIFDVINALPLKSPDRTR